MSYSLNALPVEFHLTTAPLTPNGLAGFEALCQRVGGKALLIELARGQHCQQPMLSLVKTDIAPATALVEARKLAEQFGDGGYSVLRLKLEVPAWGAAWARLAQLATGGTYYEWHGRVWYEREAELRAWCEQHAVHLSSNALRHRPDTRFVTLREFGPVAQFAARVAAVQDGLAANGWNVAKQQAEFCFFDSQISLDAGWLTT
ncbi:hypothetical protein [Hymenobacter ruricola]|uniref:DUF4123 domain-containing protein n=1 Tax=Hymenobacter ruricola TaxID=2791023 RepID=A0ABS0HZV1_9BACT|nr:hypothetical protein [Hymenobacter ruricola]MBF9220241.1 hypothetical protein [Hymenobacter ruricola]